METPQTFGRWLHDARRARGLSREALATHVGCAAITIRKIEGDERRPSQPFAERLFAVLEIPAAEWPPLLRLARVTSAVSPPLVPAASLDLAGLPGTTIHGYTLREQIGSGGFGAVFRAEQPMIGRDVAIKVILPQYADHPDFIRRFEAEAQIVARLEHPHIVPLYDYWRESGGAYLVMRYIRGGNLHAGVHEAPWPLDRMTRVLEQVGEALQLAHQLGVVHRDVKPANILLDLRRRAACDAQPGYHSAPLRCVERRAAARAARAYRPGPGRRLRA